MARPAPPRPPPPTPSVPLTNAACALRAEPETGVTRARVATGSWDAASRAADLGIALTHARGGTWGSSQPGFPHLLHPRPIRPSAILSDPLPKTPSRRSLLKPRVFTCDHLFYAGRFSSDPLPKFPHNTIPKIPFLNILLFNYLPQVSS